MIIPGDDMIRALSGEALTVLAVQLGLMDREHYYHEADTGPGSGRFVNLSLWKQFAPHEELAHADAVVRQMRQAGFITRVYAGADFGRVLIQQSVRQQKSRERQWPIEVLWGEGEAGTPPEESECLALLRCACVAMARWKREEAPCE